MPEQQPTESFFGNNGHNDHTVPQQVPAIIVTPPPHPPVMPATPRRSQRLRIIQNLDPIPIPNLDDEVETVVAPIIRTTGMPRTQRVSINRTIRRRRTPRTLPSIQSGQAAIRMAQQAMEERPVLRLRQVVQNAPRINYFQVLFVGSMNTNNEEPVDSDDE
jgi:hypothetical protein